MKSHGGTFPGLRRTGIAALSAFLLLSVAVSFVSLRAFADDQANDSAVRFYFAVPFAPAQEKKAPRLGFQILTEIDDEGDYTPIPHELGMYTTLDLGFTLDGLAKLDVGGTDMRDVYARFARSIGLASDDVGLCGEVDCPELVKPDGMAIAPSRPPGTE